jgi:hypothetical protein
VRSDRIVIAKTKQVIKAKTAGKPLPLIRCGIRVPNPREERQKNPENFRDLTHAVRHLTYHIYPVLNAEESWWWNLQQLADRWTLFSGKKILGVNVGGGAATEAEVLQISDEMGLTWDHVVVRPNDPGLGEVMTWVPSLELLSPETAAPNEVVFSAHAKGVKYGGCPPLIREWANVMYEANLDFWDLVQQELSWCLSTGAFRARYRRTVGCVYGWYYSGAFWWWRLHDVGQRNWRNTARHYAGRELWIGNQIRKEESSCLFLDNSRSPYDQAYWNKVIRPRWFTQKTKG